jgi:hypothetical protein
MVDLPARDAPLLTLHHSRCGTFGSTRMSAPGIARHIIWPILPGLKPPLGGAALRKTIMALWSMAMSLGARHSRACYRGGRPVFWNPLLKSHRSALPGQNPQMEPDQAWSV